VEERRGHGKLKTRRHGGEGEGLDGRGAHPVAYAQGFYGMETTDKLKTCRHGGRERVGPRGADNPDSLA
jgi:hypothetical protein